MSQAIDRAPEPELLNDRQRDFLKHVAGGMPAQQAATAAGYAPAYARKASRLLKQPMIAKELELIRAKARDLAGYDVAMAMDEAKRDHDFAVAKGNPMAAVKATELRSKLAGLLIDRVEIATVDLTSALARAEARVLSTSNSASSPLSLPSKSPIRWSPSIPGDNTERGSADGQAGN